MRLLSGWRGTQIALCRRQMLLWLFPLILVSRQCRWRIERGPRTLPWSMPASIGNVVVVASKYLTMNCLFVR